MALLQMNERTSLSPVVITDFEAGDESVLQRYGNELQAANRERTLRKRYLSSIIFT